MRTLLLMFACVCGFRFQALFWFVACCPSVAMFGASSGGRICVRAVFRCGCFRMRYSCLQNCLGQLRCFANAFFCNILQGFAMPFNRASGLSYVVNVVTNTFSCTWSWGPPNLTIVTITDHFEHSMADACKHAVCKQSDKDRASDFLFDFGSPKEPEKESK